MNHKKPVKELKRQLKLAYESKLIEIYLVHEDSQIDIFPQDAYDSHIVFTFTEDTPMETRRKLITYIESAFESVMVSSKAGMKIIWIDYIWAQ
jgi:hypothetical protein